MVLHTDWFTVNQLMIMIYAGQYDVLNFIDFCTKSRYIRLYPSSCYGKCDYHNLSLIMNNTINLGYSAKSSFKWL